MSVLVFHTVDFDYTETLDIPVVQGRTFSTNFPSDSSGAFMVNEELARRIGGESVIGKSFQIFWMKGEIIGVFKDYHHLSFHQQIEPMVFLMAPNPYWKSNMVVKLNSNNMQETLKFIESTWKELAPNYPFEYRFLEEDYDQMYRIEARLGYLLNIFTILAVIIACLGLLGLSSFTTAQRTKEIGIRKVLGGSSRKIIISLSKEFVIWVLIANLISWPLAWIVIKKWLDGFAYRIPFGIDHFIYSAVIALSIAFLTVILQTYKAARKNPVDTLRYE